MPKKYKNRGDYEVGFGKPPKHTRWPKGQSGNPSGKKTMQQSIKDQLNAIAGEEIIVHKNGQTVAMTNLEAAFYAAFAKAQSGNPQVLKILIHELGIGTADIPGPPALEVTEADLAVLQTEADFLALIEQGKAEMAGPEPSDVKEEDDDDDPHEDF